MNARTIGFATIVVFVASPMMGASCVPRGGEVDIPCPPELVQNNSFQRGTFTGAELGTVFNPGVTLLDVNNDCTRTGGGCLENWTIAAVGSPQGHQLAWLSNEHGITGIPLAPPPPGNDKFLDLSGNGDSDPFPFVSQQIHLDPGRYQLQFDLGQGETPDQKIHKPVSVDVTIGVTAVGKPPQSFTTNPNGDAWQTFNWTFTTNGTDITPFRNTSR